MTESGSTDKRAADKAGPKAKNKNQTNTEGNDSAKNQPGVTTQSETKKSAKASDNGGKPTGKQPKKPAAGKTKKGRGAVVLALFAILIALASVLGVGALWYWGQMQFASLDKRTDTVERGLESNVQDVVLPRLQKLNQAQQKLQQANQAQAQEIKQLSQALDQSRVQLSGLTDKLEGGRYRWKLMEIEDLLLTANTRLQLYKDAGGAQQALNLAGRSIRALNDPRLFKIREKIVDEVAALDALPKPDIQGMALSLGSLIHQVPQLPLADKTANEYNNGGAGQTLHLPEAPWRHFLSSVKQALSGMLTIRHDGANYKPLMPPEQTFFLYQNLRLKLQAGRLALLQKNSMSFSESLGEAQKWLNGYFNTDDAAVAAAIQHLGQMRKIELDWDAPDISGSLQALRAYVSAQSAANGQVPAKSQHEDQAKDKAEEQAKDNETAADAAAGSQ